MTSVGFVPRTPRVRPVSVPPANAFPHRRRLGLALLAVALCAAGVAVGTAVPPGPAGGVGPPTAADACAPGWVTAWQAAAQPAPAAVLPEGATTMRMVVQPQVTGTQVRVRLSNEFGTTPLVVGTVSAARSDGAAGLVPGSVRPVTFGGRAGVVIPPGSRAVSDPVPVVAEVGVPLAVSIHLPVRPEVLTRHAVALQTSYLSRTGDVALVAEGAAFETAVPSWLVLTGVDVLAPRPVNAVVAVGDSITDGIGSPSDADERWSDALVERLARVGGTSRMAVLNAGISRNQLLVDDPVVLGESPLTRFDRDVIAAAGATDVVLHIGTNDIAAGRSADEVIAGLQRFTDRAHAGGKRVFLTTITPSDAGAHGTREANATREAVNLWVRTHGRDDADGVFDFATAVADPARPSRLAPAFDAGDGLHLSAAGYRALAGSVDPGRLSGSPCLADSTPVRVLVSGS